MTMLNRLHEISFWRNRRLPVILQTEAAECGLACLCMIATFYGHAIDVSYLRRRFSVSIKGMSLKGLVSIAEGLKMQARPLKLEIEDLCDLRMPCILHWDMSHFVVLKKKKQGFLTIHDPRFGVRTVSMVDAANHFTGVALELTPASRFEIKREVHDFSLFSLLGKVIGLRSILARILLLGLCLQVCALAAPFYMQWLVDEAVISGDRDLVAVLGFGFLLLVTIQTALTAIRSWMSVALATDLHFQWLGNTFSHLVKLPLSYFEKRHTGDVVSRFGSIQTIQNSLTTQLVEGLIDGVLVFGTFVMMMVYNSFLAIIAVGTLALYGVIRVILYAPTRSAAAEQIVHEAKQRSHFMETVRGIQTIRLFNHDDARRTRWLSTLADQFNAELRVARLGVSYETASSLIFGVERIAVIWVAALSVLDGLFSVGMLFAFISYKDQFTQRTISLLDRVFDFRMLRLHGDRVADIVLTHAEQESCSVEVPHNSIRASIEIRNVKFRYGDSEPYILDGVSLTIDAGECVAITGISGCGKTTLIKLILGLLEPSEGDILIGGVNVRHLGLANYRRLVGSVMQEDMLFAGSIADNISFFDDLPELSRIYSSASLAAVAFEISRMPMGFNTLVSDTGCGLSGGQRQRVLLARALYRNPKLLVLDEATSHMDVWNEQEVNKAVQNIALTRIIVAHRPETIAMAERVFVMHAGTIKENIA